MRWLRSLVLLVRVLHSRCWSHLTWVAGLCRRTGLPLIALLRIRVLHCQMMLLCLSLLLLCLCLCLLLLGLLLLLLLGLLLLHHGLVLALLSLLLLLSHLQLLLSEVGWQLHRVHLLLLVVLERLLVLLLLHHQRLQLLRVHLLHLLGRDSHCLCLLDHPLAHDVLLLLLKLGHHGRIAAGLLKLLLLHELLLLLRSHVHGGLCASHVLGSHALTWHAHSSSRMLVSHSSSGTWLHASNGSGLHAHHGAGLANVRRPRYTGVHLHLLAHVLVWCRRHPRVAVGHARVHTVSGRVCRHHFAVA